LKFFEKIVSYARTVRRPRIILDQRSIRYLGLGADSILGVLLAEIRQEIRFSFGSYIKGYKPKDREIQRLMDEVGSVRVLFMSADEDIRLSFSSGAKVYRHRHRPPDSGSESNTFDPAALAISDFSDHLSHCLSYLGRSLNSAGRSRLCDYAAEIVDNVKEHAGLEEWAIVGYSDFDAVNPTYRCVIFCFGKTIAETFIELGDDTFPRRTIAPYIEAHKGGLLFAEDWREKDLITLVALQGDISSKSTDATSDRGQGTVKLIQFFQNIVDECDLTNSKTEMNIISGSTRIRFDKRYRMQFNSAINREVIAFNRANDLLERPDSSAVISLGDSHFPGTLITVEMPMRSTFLDAEVCDED
jgi:hypothetical protein